MVMATADTVIEEYMTTYSHVCVDNRYPMVVSGAVVFARQLTSPSLSPLATSKRQLQTGLTEKQSADRQGLPVFSLPITVLLSSWLMTWEYFRRCGKNKEGENRRIDCR